IISTASTISIATTSTEARDKVIGNTIRNTAETLLMGTEEQQIDLGATLANSQEAAIVRAVALGLGIDPAVVLELGAESLAIDRAVVQARVIARGVELVLESSQVVALELELVQVEAEQERGPGVPLE